MAMRTDVRARQVDANGASLYVEERGEGEPLLQQSVEMWLAYPGLNLEDLARIQTPSLVVVGDRDGSADVHLAVDMYHRPPNAELAILPGHNHIRCLSEPDMLVAAVADFLKRH